MPMYFHRHFNVTTRLNAMMARVATKGSHPIHSSGDKGSHPFTRVATKAPTVMNVDRGGLRQRRARREAERPPPQSALASLIVQRVVLGHMSPQDAQQFAAAAETDVRACQEYVHGDAVFSLVGLHAIAGLGHGGHFAQHAWSGFLSLIKGVQISEPFARELPILWNSTYTPCHQFFMLPHQLFANLYHHYRSEFRRRILGAEGAIEHFWNTMSDHPALNDHPMKEKRNWKTLYVPIALHGDGVPISGVGKSWQRSAEIWSWN